MSHWLEEAERKISQDDEKLSLENKLKARKEGIRINYLENKAYYDGFISQLEEISVRINELPLEYRMVFGKLNFNSKESSLGNKLYYITSSQRIKKRLYKGVLNFFKKHHFKYIRVAYFTVSRHPGLIDIELKENLLLRFRMKANGDRKKSSIRKNKQGDKKDQLIRLNMKEMSKEKAMEIIDWLVFKKEMEEISFLSKEDQVGSSLSS